MPANSPPLAARWRSGTATPGGPEPLGRRASRSSWAARGARASSGRPGATRGRASATPGVSASAAATRAAALRRERPSGCRPVSTSRWSSQRPARRAGAAAGAPAPTSSRAPVLDETGDRDARARLERPAQRGDRRRDRAAGSAALDARRRAAQRLVERRDAQPIGASRHEHARRRHQAVAVRIRLDDRGDRRAGTRRAPRAPAGCAPARPCRSRATRRAAAWRPAGGRSSSGARSIVIRRVLRDRSPAPPGACEPERSPSAGRRSRAARGGAGRVAAPAAGRTRAGRRRRALAHVLARGAVQVDAEPRRVPRRHALGEQRPR